MPSGRPVQMVPAGGHVSNSSVPHGSKQSPAMHVVPLLQAASSRHTVQPEGAGSQRCGALPVHRFAPVWHWFMHGGMHTPSSQRSPPPTSHWPVCPKARQPFAASWHVSMTPEAPQRFVPSTQVVAQAAQVPFAQKESGGQLCVGPHAGQLFESMPHVSMPLPLHRIVPFPHEVPHTPHAPPEQNVAQASLKLQAVHPRASATHVSTLRPVHRLAPAVHAVAHEVQAPLVQTLPLGQARDDHRVQPDSTSQSHVSTPVAVQRLAPIAQAVHEPQLPLLHTSP